MWVVVNHFVLIYSELFQNTTIEERVALLEIQMIEIQEDVTEIEEDVTGLNVGLMEVDENVDFLLDETVIQDERLFSLEEESDVLNEEVEGWNVFSIISCQE